MGWRKFGRVSVAAVWQNHAVNRDVGVGRRTREGDERGNKWVWGRLGSSSRPDHACLWLILIQCRWYLVYVLMYDCNQIWKRKK